MPYNPYSYPQFYPQGQQYAPSYQQNYPQSYPQSNGITWVTGIEGAKAYPVGAGNNALLMDSEESVFYIKSSDSSGMPMPLRVFDYVERTGEKKPEVDFSNFVTKQELAETVEKLTPKKKKKHYDDDEEE